MANYLFIESRDPFESHEVRDSYELAQGLVDQGDKVTVFLVQNAVLPVRKNKFSHLIEDMAKKGVQVMADDFALQMRGITNDKMIPEVAIGKLDTVVDSLAAGHKVIWN